MALLLDKQGKIPQVIGRPYFVKSSFLVFDKINLTPYPRCAPSSYCLTVPSSLLPSGSILFPRYFQGKILACSFPLYCVESNINRQCKALCLDYVPRSFQLKHFPLIIPITASLPLFPVQTLHAHHSESKDYTPNRLDSVSP